MIGDRKATYLRPALLAAPPIVMVGILCNNLMPDPAPVPAVVAANDPEVGATPLGPAKAMRRPAARFAGQAH